MSLTLLSTSEAIGSRLETDFVNNTAQICNTIHVYEQVTVCTTNCDVPFNGVPSIFPRLAKTKARVMKSPAQTQTNRVNRRIPIGALLVIAACYTGASIAASAAPDLILVHG
jgi:hypothetical protein